MARLTIGNKQVLEQLFQMGGGYVLNFSDRTFAEFFNEAVGVDINDPQYQYSGGSKANRMRGFWRTADDALIARSIKELLAYIDLQIDLGRLSRDDFPDTLVRRAGAIAEGLLDSKSQESTALEGTLSQGRSQESKPASVEPRAAFLSYCRTDVDFANKLAKDLKAGGASIWLDTMDIRPGAVWDDAIEEALAECSQLLVILSETSVNSKNVRDEVSFALDKQKAVIPLLYRNCEIPLRLRRLQHIDFLKTSYDDGCRLLLQTLGVYAPARADYAVEPSGDIVVFLSERSTRRGSGTARPAIGARLAFKTKHDAARFVEIGESEGFTFEGKEFIAGY